ncbi:PHP-associated domain-containing protein [Haloarcula salina]|uniref:PHP domain-containing protein n=1 Tax=Haloarcula salina TaxID=1429914 RepID=A0AA41KJF5_9EURY|nr:PHP-associated domain-containing protein [Haloarcula salina]MBV0900834.1 PHP domain-containing protein [Haloarcula salina]
MQREGYAVDMHVKVLDERVVERAKERGLDALVYAPHFTRLPEIRSRAAAFSDDELTVFPARELFTGAWQERRHVLAIGLDEPVPDFITLEGAMTELERQGAAVLVPHPGYLNVSMGLEDIERYRDIIDAVEIYNPKQLSYHWDRARAFAERTGHETFVSSYAHLRGTVGEVSVAFDEGLDDVTALTRALKTDAKRTLIHRDGPSHALRRALEWAHLGFENTWGKFDRLMLQGTEPTHPDHVAYDDRFDDVKVY